LLTLTAPFRRIIDFYRDREYFSQLTKIAFPIILQNTVSSSLNLVGSLIIGQKGEVAVASVGLAGQIFFLLNLLLFGIGSGAAMFTAQLWGKHDVPNIRRVLGLSLMLSFIGTTFFFVLAELFPAQVLSIYSQDPAVVALGSQYLRIFGWSFIFFSITFTYALVLRSIGDVRMPVAVSMFALGLNAILTYGLVFGKLGLPELGVPGGAWALVIARAVECILLVAITYLKKSPVAATLKDFLSIDFHFLSKILIPVLPVIANEFLWSMGIATYNVVYARMGTASIAAINIAATVDNMALVILFGITSATSVIVGNRIGAGENEKGFLYAARSLGLAATFGVMLGLAVILLSPLVLSFYKVNPAVIELARRTLIVVGLFIPMRAMNMVMIVGIFRSGGDTLFALALDGFIIWILGVPSAFIAAFVLGVPVYFVYLAVMSEEFAKWSIGLWRFLSRKWIHNLTRTV
jgi:putative MATE family efflux protein